MKATERTLQQLLHSSDQYVIPVFQRYYTWTTANWEQLLEDIGELLDAADDRRHFMGSIVTVPDGHQPGVVPAYQVIDGQQRLTTISILLCSVRDVALARGWNDLAAEVEESYLVHRFKKNRDGSVNAALRAIRDLNVTTAYPLVTTLLERHLRNELPKEDLISALRSIASFVLRRYVCGQSSRGYSTWFVAACRELGAEPAKSVLTFLRAKGWPSDDEFRVKFIRHNLYQSKYDRAVLGALELAIQAKSEPVLLDGCSIEHVTPQTIDEADDDGKAWIAVLGADWKQLHAEWLHTPGNLTLVGADYNAEMSNRAFDLKKPVLGASKVYMNQHFKGDALKTWSQGEIEARAKLLADLAIKVWPAPPSATT